MEKYWVEGRVRPTEETFYDGNRWGALKNVLNGLLPTVENINAEEQLIRLKKIKLETWPEFIRKFSVAT